MYLRKVRPVGAPCNSGLELWVGGDEEHIKREDPPLPVPAMFEKGRAAFSPLSLLLLKNKLNSSFNMLRLCLVKSNRTLDSYS
jgi:hypothetical protein